MRLSMLCCSSTGHLCLSVRDASSLTFSKQTDLEDEDAVDVVQNDEGHNNLQVVHPGRTGRERAVQRPSTIKDGRRGRDEELRLRESHEDGLGCRFQCSLRFRRRGFRNGRHLARCAQGTSRTLRSVAPWTW